MVTAPIKIKAFIALVNLRFKTFVDTYHKENYMIGEIDWLALYIRHVADIWQLDITELFNKVNALPIRKAPNGRPTKD